MMANNDFIVEIIDSSTSLPLPTINIGNRTYISAEAGITFHIKCACSNIKKYTKKGKKLSCKPFVDGNRIGYSLQLQKKTNLPSICIFDHQNRKSGKHSLIFKEIELEDAESDKVDNGNSSEMGTIMVEFWETKRTGKKIEPEISEIIPVVHRNKNDIITSYGERLRDIEQVHEIEYIQKYCEIKLYIQTPAGIDALKRNDDLNKNIVNEQTATSSSSTAVLESSTPISLLSSPAAVLESSIPEEQKTPSLKRIPSHDITEQKEKKSKLDGEAINENDKFLANKN